MHVRVFNDNIPNVASIVVEISSFACIIKHRSKIDQEK